MCIEYGLSYFEVLTKSHRKQIIPNHHKVIPAMMDGNLKLRFQTRNTIGTYSALITFTVPRNELEKLLTPFSSWQARGGKWYQSMCTAGDSVATVKIILKYKISDVFIVRQSLVAPVLPHGPTQPTSHSHLTVSKSGTKHNSADRCHQA